MQAQYRYGLQPKTGVIGIPFLRLPVPVNPHPEPMTYAASQKILDTFVSDLETAEATLARIEDTAEVRLPIHFGRIRLDLNGDGRADVEERLWKILAVVLGTPRDGAAVNLNPDEYLAVFDTADVYWLRGYCHLLSAVADIAMAYDGRKLFDHTAQLFYPSANVPYRFLRDSDQGQWTYFADVIALVHLIDFPVADPARLKSAHGHLLDVIEMSRVSWRETLAEVDDDHEWIPGPAQTAAPPRAAITRDMVDSWHEFLEEFEELLEGRKLIPFWRGKDQNRGINLKRVFYEPQKFDLVLWVQGPGAAAYLEQGEVTRIDFWQRLFNRFNGRFWGFALWFN